LAKIVHLLLQLDVVASANEEKQESRNNAFSSWPYYYT
jgi:hypothetical protein